MKTEAQTISMLTQWAKHLGATVIGTVGSPEKAELVRANGADYVIDYDVAATRVRTRNIATNLFEVHDAGTLRERRTPVADGRGYVWRVNNYCSFEVVREGIVEQCETISLSRDIPFGFGLILGKFARTVPRETLEFTLGHVRSGLMR